MDTGLVTKLPRRATIPTLLGLVLLVGLAAFLLSRKGVMPLDERTLGRYQEANSRAMRKLLEAHSEMAPPVQAAVALRMAMHDLGYDPDRTIAYWLSPEFRQEVAGGDPALAPMKLRLTGSLVAVALGDTANADQFQEILSRLGSDLRTAARKRRGLPASD